MSPAPDQVTGLTADPSIARTVLSWRSLGFDPLIDHYRVHAVNAADAAFEPSAENLMAKTVYPRWQHDGLDTLGETWTYRVLAISDAGKRGKASSPLTASSKVSVVATGREVVAIGNFDGKTLEHRFAPNSYAQIEKAYPTAEFNYVQGQDTPDTAWPYLLPGPIDSWAGLKSYRATWTFDLDAAAEDDHDLAIWLVDTTRVGGTLEVNLNGSALTVVDLPIGSTRGSREGDANLPGSPLLRSYHEYALPAATLQAGENMIEFVLADGSWVAWDAVGVFARPEES